jgi:hypothetical protein
MTTYSWFATSHALKGQPCMCFWNWFFLMYTLTSVPCPGNVARKCCTSALGIWEWRLIFLHQPHESSTAVSRSFCKFTTLAGVHFSSSFGPCLLSMAYKLAERLICYRKLSRKTFESMQFWIHSPTWLVRVCGRWNADPGKKSLW